MPSLCQIREKPSKTSKCIPKAAFFLPSISLPCKRKTLSLWSMLSFELESTDLYLVPAVPPEHSKDKFTG